MLMNKITCRTHPNTMIQQVAASAVDTLPLSFIVF